MDKQELLELKAKVDAALEAIETNPAVVGGVEVAKKVGEKVEEIAKDPRTRSFVVRHWREIVIGVFVIALGVGGWMFNNKRLELKEAQEALNRAKSIEALEIKLGEVGDRQKNLYPQLEQKRKIIETLIKENERLRSMIPVPDNAAISAAVQELTVPETSNEFKRRGFPNTVVNAK